MVDMANQLLSHDMQADHSTQSWAEQSLCGFQSHDRICVESGQSKTFIIYFNHLYTNKLKFAHTQKIGKNKQKRRLKGQVKQQSESLRQNQQNREFSSQRNVRLLSCAGGLAEGLQNEGLFTSRDRMDKGNHKNSESYLKREVKPGPGRKGNHKETNGTSRRMPSGYTRKE